MKKFVCSICGYVYEGENLPADYKCPQCKAPAAKFNEVVENQLNWACQHIVGIGKEGADAACAASEVKCFATVYSTP